MVPTNEKIASGVIECANVTSLNPLLVGEH